MEFGSDDIINIFLQFRNPDTANEANDQILEFLNNPQSIIIIFEIISIQEIDDFIYQIAIMSISKYLEIEKDSIDDEILESIRINLINVLKNYRNLEYVPLIIEQMSCVIKLFPSDWPEIIEYAFNIDPSEFFIHIKLLSMLMPYFTEETIVEKIEFFTQLLTDIFQQDCMSSDNPLDCIKIQCSSVSFVVELVKRTQEVELVEQLRPLITQLLQTVISETNFDTDLLNQILNPISRIPNLRLNVIDVSIVIKLVINSITNKVVPDEYKFQLNNLLEICSRDTEFQFPEEIYRYILAVEFNICIKMYRIEQEDEAFTWSYQIGDIIDNIFSHSSSQFIINNVRRNFMEYYQNEDDGIRFFQILLLNILAKFPLSDADDLLIELYPILFSFLGDSSERIRKYTAITLGFVSSRIKDFIIENMNEILDDVNGFVAEYQDDAGTFLLMSLIDCANNTDDFIQSEYEFIKEFLSCPNVVVCKDSIEIIHLLITKSRSKYEYISQDAYTTLTTAISDDPSRFSSLFMPLTYLFCQDDNLHEHLTEIISLINDGLTSGDKDVISDSLNAIQSIIIYFKEKKSDDRFSIIEVLFPSIKNIATLPGDDDIVCSIKGSSFITLASVLYASDMNEEILKFYFELVDCYFETDNDVLTICMTNSFYKIIYLNHQTAEDNDIMLNNEYIQNDVSQLIQKIITSFKFNDFFDDIIIKFISSSIQFFGFERLSIDFNTIGDYFLSKMKFYISDQDDFTTETDKKMMKIISEGLVTLLNTDSDEQSEAEFAQQFLQYSVDLLNNQMSPSGQVGAIYIFSLMLKNEKLRSFFSDQSFDELIKQIISFLAEPDYKIVKSASKFFNTILASNKEQLQPYSLNIVQSLFLRLVSTNGRQNQSILLREMLIVTICNFCKNYSEDIMPEQLPQAILPYLPLTNKIKYANTVYCFLFQSNIQAIIDDDVELIRHMFRILVLVISDQNKESNFLDKNVLYLMANYINSHSYIFTSEEEEKESIAQIIGYDELAFQSFYELYPLYLSEYNQMAYPDIDFANVPVIDLTKEVF